MGLLILAAVTAAIPLKPGGPWKMDYSGMTCVLSRPFGTGKDQVGLAFSPDILGRYITVTILSATDPKMATAGSLTLTDGGDGELRFDATGADDPQLNAHVTRGQPRVADVRALLGKAQQLTISYGKAFTHVVAVGSATKALAGLDTCLQDLQRTAGIDPATMIDASPYRTNRRSLVRKPAEEVVNVWMNIFDDYRKMPKIVSGDVTVLWHVGPDLLPHDCRAILSGVSDELDTFTCSLIVRNGAYVKLPATVDRPGAVAWDSITVKWRDSGMIMGHGPLTW